MTVYLYINYILEGVIMKQQALILGLTRSKGVSKKTGNEYDICKVNCVLGISRSLIPASRSPQF